jgi:hypothetical protein
MCVEHVNPSGFGLMVHSNIAEVMSTLPVDRWLKNTAALAQERGIPVVVEYFLGAGSEELEPFVHLAHPLVILCALRAIAAVPGVVGIKEYYGLAPDREIQTWVRRRCSSPTRRSAMSRPSRHWQRNIKRLLAAWSISGG